MQTRSSINTATTICEMGEGAEEEETYDNFDPTRDRYEWSPLSCADWQIDWQQQQPNNSNDDDDEEEEEEEEEGSSELGSSIIPKTLSDLDKLQEQQQRSNQSSPESDSFKQQQQQRRRPKRPGRRRRREGRGDSIAYKWLSLTGSCWSRFKIVLNSARFNMLVVILIVMNCLAISGEVITDYVERALYERRTADESLSEFKSTTVGTALGLLEQVFKYLAIVIMSVQVLEDVLRMAVYCSSFSLSSCFSTSASASSSSSSASSSLRRCLAQPFEIFDTLLVFFTFALNLYLFNKSDHHVHSVTGLIILLRLWRIKKLVDGVYSSVKRKHLHELKILQDKIALLERHHQV